MEWGNKVRTNGLCHMTMTKIAAMSIYGKNLLKYFSGTKKPTTLKLFARVLPNLFKWWHWDEYMTIYDNPRSRQFIDLCPRSLRFNIFKLLCLKIKKIKTLGCLKPNFIWRIHGMLRWKFVQKTHTWPRWLAGRVLVESGRGPGLGLGHAW